MKYLCLIFFTLFISACSTSEMRTTQSTEKSARSSGTLSDPYEIGSVDTAFKILGPDHKIEVGGVPDPKVSGVTCFYSRAKKGGVTGAVGIAEDTSDASVACRQTSDIAFKEAIEPVEEIWKESTSFFFKKLRIIRFYDANSNSLIYLVYSDKLIDGSPKNSISAVPLNSITPQMKESK
ncbi:MAG: CreA family protein [Candidatus Gracilibacteria bacterium]